jgi:hypothetical protein
MRYRSEVISVGTTTSLEYASSLSGWLRAMPKRRPVRRRQVPAVVGTLPLRLELVSATQYKSGVITLRYRPANG